MISPGDIWSVDFGEPYPSEPAFTRPAVLLGPPMGFGERFPYRLVVPLTRTAHGLTWHIEIEPSPGNGLKSVSYAQAEALRSVASARLLRALGAVDSAELLRIRAAVAQLLSFDARSA